MIVHEMAKALGLPESHVEALANAASHNYKQYTMPRLTRD